ncbi:MAG: hypothetical protein UY52_C0012G0032 [Parcubacteria group bacterium GW2011_GWC2_49_9]|nr:MAG: hypothetical protein UY52_C0012G0032 [Parcubacteria group bacterium GW2011_GWC2_49_9]
MNVTELARQLKIPTTALKDLIPKLGFDVGRKAIKIDTRVAEQIMEKIKAQPGLLERIRRGKPIPVEITEDHPQASSTEKRILVLPQKIAVRDFADQLGMPDLRRSMSTLTSKQHRSSLKISVITQH